MAGPHVVPIAHAEVIKNKDLFIVKLKKIARLFVTCANNVFL